MPDYFNKFSVIVPLKDDSEKEYAFTLDKAVRDHIDEDKSLPKDFPINLEEAVADWTFEVEAVDEGIWLYSDNCGIDGAAELISHLLEQFNPTGHIEFEWSKDCSDPEPGAYGGGAVYITAKEIKSINTSEWLYSMSKKSRAKKRRTK